MGPILGSLFTVEREERLKVILLAGAFFLVIGAYTVASELKNSIFLQTVGKDSIPLARMLTMFSLVPLIFLYSRLVDTVRRYQLLYIYSLAFSVLGLVFVYFLGHPTIGIPNTQASPWRIFGWLFYFYVESYPPFLVSVFWAFANSINNPESAKKCYALIVAGSKLGGMLGAGVALMLLSTLCVPGAQCLSDTVSHQILLIFASLLLLLVPVVVYFLMKWVPGRNLHGYEAAYQFEKQRGKEHPVKGILEDITSSLSGMFGGLTMIINQPYVLGIFGMSFFYEVVYVVFSYLRVSVAQSESSSLSALSSTLYKQILIVQFIGFLISIVGTQLLLRFLGERRCLLLIPVTSGVFLLYLLITNSALAVTVGWIALRAINFAFSQPIRESLYIPTVKDLKFKSKSWIDAFGSKLAKSTGSSFNMMANQLGATWFLPLHACFFIGVLGVWFVTAVLLGRRYEKAIADNEVIGAEEEIAIS